MQMSPIHGVIRSFNMQTSDSIGYKRHDGVLESDQTRLNRNHVHFSRVDNAPHGESEKEAREMRPTINHWPKKQTLMKPHTS